MYDVIVVGGGPAGCHAACLLAQKGLDVHVLEEHPAIGEPVDCSGVIGAESFAASQFPESLKLGEVNALTLVSPSQLKVRFFPSSPLAYIVDRAALDRAIARRATESGAVLHLGTRVVDIRVLDDCMELDVEARKRGSEPPSLLALQPTGTADDQLPITNDLPRRRLRARVAILAGGPRYQFQRKLGMGRPRDFLRTAQVEMPVHGIKETSVRLGSEQAPGSFAWIVPFQRKGEEFARVGVSARVGALPYLKKLLRRLTAEGHLTSSGTSIRSWVIPVGPLRRTYSDRALAVGDAAGQTKPTTGGGIYYAILCAEAAANTLVTAFEKGRFDAGTLSAYEREWRRNLGREIRMGKIFRRLSERLRDDEIDELFRIVQSDGILAEVGRKARFDWHKDVIHFALRHPALGGIFLKGLFR